MGNQVASTEGADAVESTKKLQRAAAWAERQLKPSESEQGLVAANLLARWKQRTAARDASELRGWDLLRAKVSAIARLGDLVPGQEVGLTHRATIADYRSG